MKYFRFMILTRSVDHSRSLSRANFQTFTLHQQSNLQSELDKVRQKLLIIGHQNSGKTLISRQFLNEQSFFLWCENSRGTNISFLNSNTNYQFDLNITYSLGQSALLGQYVPPNSTPLLCVIVGPLGQYAPMKTILRGRMNTKHIFNMTRLKNIFQEHDFLRHLKFPPFSPLLLSRGKGRDFQAP